MTSFGLHVVLVEPEIPQNTGSIGRLCLATGATLHLVEPLGFDVSQAAVRRAGLDYWEHLQPVRHSSVEEFLRVLPPQAPKALFTKKAGTSLFERKFERGTWLIFGRETSGLSDSIVNRFGLDCVRIPLFDARVRSLNLAQAVAIGVYEAIRDISTLSEKPEK